MEKLQTKIRKIRILILSTAAVSGLLILALLVFVPVDEKIAAVGVVLAEKESYVYATEEGLIESVQTFDGKEIRKGDVILALDSRDQENRKTQLDAEMKEAVATLELEQAKLDKTSKLPLPKEFWHARNELAEAEQKVRYARLELDRFQQLLAEKLASQSDYDARKFADDLAQTELAKVRERVAVLDKGLEETIKKEALAQFHAAAARLERLKVDGQVCAEQIERRIMRAPMDGKITYLAKRRIGERVLKGEELAHISQGEANRARLLVGESQVHRIKPGQRVRMKSNVFEFMRYGYIEAHVDEVSLEPYARQSSVSVPESAYRVMAKIDRAPIPLILGSSLEAKIILRRMPIWQLFLPRS